MEPASCSIVVLPFATVATSSSVTFVASEAFNP
jgi:hypothetical protein